MFHELDAEVMEDGEAVVPGPIGPPSLGPFRRLNLQFGGKLKHRLQFTVHLICITRIASRSLHVSQSVSLCAHVTHLRFIARNVLRAPTFHQARMWLHMIALAPR
jgi:hypothetical protein